MKTQKHNLKSVEEFEMLAINYQNEYERLKQVEKTTDARAQKYFREQVARFINQGNLILSELKQKEDELDIGFVNYKNSDEILESEDVYLGMLAYFSGEKKRVSTVSEVIKHYQKMYEELDFGEKGSKKNTEPPQRQ